MSNTSFRTVTVAGATGALGYLIADALLDDGSYKVKILRKEPKNENKNADLLASKGAEIVYVDYSQKDGLLKSLKGTDVLISVITSGDPANDLYKLQSPLFAAAKEAGVKRVIPSEFGCGYRYLSNIFFPVVSCDKIVMIFSFATQSGSPPFHGSPS